MLLQAFVMSNLKKRLTTFARERFNFGQNKFEEYCGIPRGTINKIKDDGGISTLTLAKIHARCPEMNLAWLLSGNGSMLVEDSWNDVNVDKPQSRAYTLPLIPHEAFAGPGLPTYDDLKIEDYYTVSEFKNSDFLIRVKGDSMTPKYNSGDLVACKRVNETYFIQWGHVYVIYTESQGIMIKRLQQSEKEGYVKCVSDNEKYAPFDVPMADIRSIAIVNGAITID